MLFFAGERSEEEDEVGMPEWMFHIGTNPCLEKRRPDRSGTFLNSDFGPFWALHIMFFLQMSLFSKQGFLFSKQGILFSKQGNLFSKPGFRDVERHREFAVCVSARGAEREMVNH